MSTAPDHLPMATIAVPDDTAERLATIDAAADALVAFNRPKNTTRAFTYDWELWEEFCTAQDFPPTTVSPGLLVAFATWLATGRNDKPPLAPASIERSLAGVLDGWKQRKVPVPHGITSKARRVVDEYRRELVRRGESTGRGKAAALTIPNLRRVSQALPNTPIGIRNRAVIVLGFAIAGRRSEIAALHVGDVVEHPSGLRVRIRDSKTGERTVAVRPGTSEWTCPVVAWRTWLAVSAIQDGPLFRKFTFKGGMGERGLTGQAVGAIVTHAGAAVGLKLSGHSLRSGLATEARRAGHDVKTIAQQGGWQPNSSVLYGYMQIVDEWTDNATEGLGL